MKRKKKMVTGTIRQMTAEEYKSIFRGMVISAAPPLVVDWKKREKK